MNNQPASTVDSLVKFNYKKKFSFSNKNLNNHGIDVSEKNDSSESSNFSPSENENEDEENEDVKSKSNKKWKGSAKLKTKKKNNNSSSSFTSDSESNKKKLKKNKKKSKTKDHNHQLKKLYRMFPHHSIDLIKKIWSDNKQNAKLSIDLLLKEKENDLKDKSLEIEEWSDGDETIRAKNKEKKINTLSNESSNSNSTINSQNNDKKRKNIQNENLKEPLRKKARKIIIESDESEHDSKKIIPSSASSSAKNSPSSTISKSSTINENENQMKKKMIIKSSSDEDEKEEEKTKSTKNKIRMLTDDEDENHVFGEHKPKKKNKKKHSKTKHRRNDDEYADQDQDDDDFDKSGASGASDDSDEENMSDDQKAAILSLFSDACVEDIQSMLNISKKRIETILSMRPFLNFTDLWRKLSEKSLLRIIDSAKDIIYARSIVTSLLAKCEQISHKMEKQVTDLININIYNNSEALLEIKSQPKNLNKNLSLKPYQLIGLNWLCLMHTYNINGILADEMGLGKTCQTIAFLSHLLETNKKFLHLIIVPPSTLDNWIREISTWSPDFNFTVYQGNLEERKHLRYDILNNKFEKPLNAILTTYGLISSTNEDKAFFKKIKVEYCVFDEAHMLKNMNSIRYQSLIKIQSKRKLLLTGTPLQNNLVELMSLLYFVMPDIFHHKTQYLNKIFSSKPSNVDTDTFYNEKIAQAKGIMKPFILRRLKTDVLKQLPKKIEEIYICDMTERQEKEYNNLVGYYKQRKDLLLKETEKANEEKEKKKNQTKSNFDEINEILTSSITKKLGVDKTTKIKENEDNSSNIVMELRKAANHPLLRRTLYDDEKLKKMAKLVMKESSPNTVYEYVLEDMSVLSDFQLHMLCPLYKGLKGFELNDQDLLCSGKFTVLNSLLQEKKEQGDRVLLFSQFVIMLDIVEEFLKIKKYNYYRLDGTTPISDRQDMIDSYNNDNEIFIFLLSTKAGGVGINLTAANVVIMHDIDYNPFNDKQAEDRCHRVGQTREVQVYKLISKHTIDETMLKIQKKKLELGADISGENDETQSKADMVSMLKEALKI